MSRPIDGAALPWRKSSYSSSGNCVEVASAGDAVRVRDTKDPAGLQLALPGARWADFVAACRRGEFDQ